MSEQEELGQNTYLLFSIGGEFFGTPLMGVREVVEFQKTRPIPQTIPSFLGVINIRGEIVGVIDLRLHLGYAVTEQRNAALMVFATPDGVLAAVADWMEGVVTIGDQDIDHNARIESRLPLAYLAGVTRIRDRLVTLIDLAKVLETEEVSKINGARRVAEAQ